MKTKKGSTDQTKIKLRRRRFKSPVNDDYDVLSVCDTDIKPAVTDHLNGQKVAKSKNSCDSELVPSCISSRTEC
jgi:hypothetical protein